MFLGSRREVKKGLVCMLASPSALVLKSEGVKKRPSLAYSIASFRKLFIQRLITCNEHNDN
jgi:hypothetical protein